MRLVRIWNKKCSIFLGTATRFRLTVATTFRFYIPFFCLSSICCLLCIMSNFFHFLFHPAPFFHVHFFLSECKQVRAVWILYNLSDRLRNIICTCWISFCRARCFAYDFSFRVFFLSAVLYISFQQNLEFWTSRSGRGTRNWRMLMNKNAWKKESAAHKQT